MIHPNIPEASSSTGGPSSASTSHSAPQAAPPPRAEFLATLKRHTAAVNVVRWSPKGEQSSLGHPSPLPACSLADICLPSSAPQRNCSRPQETVSADAQPRLPELARIGHFPGPHLLNLRSLTSLPRLPHLVLQMGLCCSGCPSLRRPTARQRPCRPRRPRLGTLPAQRRARRRTGGSR